MAMIQIGIRLLAPLLMVGSCAGCAPVAFTDPVRSVLYPTDWTPAFSDEEGRFLHDFSYAGYGRGESDFTASNELPIFNVVNEGADNSGTTDSTASIQSAIDLAEDAAGGIVYFPAGLYRCNGQLRITASNVVLRGDSPESSRLYFPADNLSFTGNFLFTGQVTRDVDILLSDDVSNRSTVIPVGDAGDLEPGDDIAIGWVITDDFIDEHGMTGIWSQFNGQWKPFFRREIIAINRDVTPHLITIDVPIRYPALLRDQASVRREHGYLSECAVENLGFSNAVGYEAAWLQNQMHFLEFHDVKDSVIRNVATFESPVPENTGYHVQSGGLMVSGCKQVSVSDCQIEKAQNRGGGGNGYLFEVRQSSEILFKDCVAVGGRHNFIQNWDFGATGIVWLRCHSEGSQAVTRAGTLEFPLRAYSEYHHSLATANLVDSCTLADGWAGGNRGTESSGAGHSAAQCVYWNINGLGSGRIRSFSHGHGYVIGTEGCTVYTTSDISFSNLDDGTEPFDFVEHLDQGSDLLPQSLYENQLARRMGTLIEGEGSLEGEGEPEGEGSIEGSPEAEAVFNHSADTNADGTFSLSELLRVVQFYNAGEFACHPSEGESTEDGFQPGPGLRDCPLHTCDYLAPEWSISLSELLRLIQLYSLGTYHACPQSEDGVCT